MKIKHNKKRNVGIIYELLVKHMSKFLIEQKITDVNKIKKIIEKNFNYNTELFKEYKAYKALLQKDINSESHAVKILSEAKHIISNIDSNNLHRQKSKLIKDINYAFGKTFYYENLKNYKELATIQTVINEWKKGLSSNTDHAINLEKIIIENMLLKNEKTNLSVNESIENGKTNRLVMEIMTKKINEKYKGFSIKQKDIIKKYAIYANDDKETLTKFLKESKTQALSSLNTFKINNDNDFLKEKISKVETNVHNLDENIINDENIIKFLTITKLVDELNSED